MQKLLVLFALVCMVLTAGCADSEEGEAAPGVTAAEGEKASGTAEPADKGEQAGEGQKEEEPARENVPEEEAKAPEPREVEVGVLETKFGTMVIEFYPNLAPRTVKRIKELIGKGFYDGLIFHRVVPGFCIQGGDPSGTGGGETGVKIPGEFSKEPFVKGSVGMARSQDPDSNDCQFFITLGRTANLDNQYSLFGKVIEGIEAAEKIEKLPLEGEKGMTRPKEEVKIISFRLEKRKLGK